jgi:uncharacterized protein (DUF302 family)
MVEQVLQLVSYGAVGAGSDGFQEVRRVFRSVDETVQRLKTAIEAAGLWILHEIDPQVLLARGGFDIAEARQLLFFRPDFMARLLAADPSALLEAPLKFAVVRLPSGEAMVRWQDPAVAFARYGDAELTRLGEELARRTTAIADAALGRPVHGDFRQAS